MLKIKTTIATLCTLAILVACDEKVEKSIVKDVKTLEATNLSSICSANANWVTDPNSPPAEIPLGSLAEICQFYQFSWQWFINLMYKPDNVTRNFFNQEKYPVFVGPTDSSCANNTEVSKFFIRSQKDVHTTASDFTVPTGENQALSDAVIYDQNGNIVLYEARFNRELCDVAQSSDTLPAGSMEIKSSWKTITETEKSDYVWVQNDADNDGDIESHEVYGLVGFHLVQSTTLHPEFIWATFEHRKNAPDCQKAPVAGTSGQWSFASEACAASLPTPTPSCEFNKTLDNNTSPAMTGTPTEICQVYAQGTSPGDNQANTNQSNIVSINAELNILFNSLPVDNSLAILRNYKLVGGIWLHDTSSPSSVISNLRGSIQLANTTMETNAQQGFSETIYTNKTVTPAANCFDCHNYSGPENNKNVSHMFSEIHGSGKQ